MSTMATNTVKVFNFFTRVLFPPKLQCFDFRLWNGCVNEAGRKRRIIVQVNAVFNVLGQTQSLLFPY